MAVVRHRRYRGRRRRPRPWFCRSCSVATATGRWRCGRLDAAMRGCTAGGDGTGSLRDDPHLAPSHLGDRSLRTGSHLAPTANPLPSRPKDRRSALPAPVSRVVALLPPLSALRSWLAGWLTTNARHEPAPRHGTRGPLASMVPSSAGSRNEG